MAAPNPIFTQDRNKWQNLAEALESGVGGILKNKIADMEKKQQQKGLSEFLLSQGLPQEQAQAYTGLTPELLGKILPQQLKTRQEQQSKLTPEQWTSLLPKGTNKDKATAIANAPSGIQTRILNDLLQEADRERNAKGLMALLPGLDAETAENLINAPQETRNLFYKNASDALVEGDIDQFLGRTGPEQPTQPLQPETAPTEAPIEEPAEEKLPPLKSVSNQDDTDAVSKGEKSYGAKILELRRKLKAEKNKKDLEKLNAEAQKYINTRLDPYVNDISKAAKASFESNKRLGRQEKLIEAGNLPHPLQAQTAKFFGDIPYIGVDLTSLLGADAEEFAKLSTDFLKGVKETFGGRVTQGEVNLFMQTVPSLLQSDEGKKRLIRNLRNFNQAILLEDNAIRQIKKENGGKIPEDLKDRVHEMIGPELDRLAEEFINAGAYVQENSIFPPPSSQKIGATIFDPAGQEWENTGQNWRLTGNKKTPNLKVEAKPEKRKVGLRSNAEYFEGLANLFSGRG